MAEEYTPMDEEELQGYVKNVLTEAIDYIDEIESPHRADAMKFYLGQPFSESDNVPEEVPGRSNYVARTIHDTVAGILPAVQRCIFGPDHVVRFEPRTIEDIEVAEQATEYISYLFKDKNNGYEVMDSVIKDALIKGIGVVQTYYENQTRLIQRDVTVDQQTLGAMSQQGWQITQAKQLPTGMIEATCVRQESSGSVKVEAVPPEELVVNRTATDLDSALVIARRQRLRVGDLIEDMGYNYDDVVDLGTDQDHETNDEWLLRNPDYKSEDEGTGLDREISYVEAYMRIDMQGTGMRQLRKICCAGGNFEILRNTPVDEHPWSIFRMEPLPHSWSGLSIYDSCADLQQVQSSIWRQILDSLALSTTPRMSYTEGQVSFEALANEEIGALIPVSQPGAIQPINVPFLGQQALPLLQVLDRVREQRTGVTDASQGMDQESLQSMTAIGVQANIKASQSRLELITRNLINTGLVPMFKRMLKLTVHHQNQQDLMLLRGKYIPVYPGSYPEMDVRVTMPLGGADTTQRTAILQQLIQKQQELLQLLGPENPLVSLQNIRAAMIRMLELNGITEAQAYFNDPAIAMQQQAQQPPQPPPPSPEQILANAELEKTRLQLLQDAYELSLKDDRERDRDTVAMYTKIQELQLKYGTQLNVDGLMQELQRNRELERSQNDVAAQAYKIALAQMSGVSPQTPPDITPQPIITPPGPAAPPGPPPGAAPPPGPQPPQPPPPGMMNG